jgi:chemotaxis protein MotB
MSKSKQTIGKAALKKSLVDQQIEESDNSWMTTYGDLITVLLTFFVMLQGLSIVNSDKFAELVNKNNFFLVPKKFEGAKFVGKGQVAIQQEDYNDLKYQKKAQERINTLSKLIIKDFRKVGLRHIVTAKPSRDRMSVKIDINSSVLFRSGKGHMTSSAEAIIDKLTNEFCKYKDIKIGIEGHTDSIPIKTVAYPSNWELSAIRATSVLRRMVDNCIDPSQITATGYGDRVPINTNGDMQSLARNRRIVIRLQY